MNLFKGLKKSGGNTTNRAQRNAKLIASMSLEQSQVLNPDQVRIGKLLGAGGFAKVYHCKLDGQSAVAKVIPSERLDDDMTYLLTNECTIWARLGHPNIASFYGMVANPDSIWLVCELLHEGSLQSRLEQRRKTRQAPPTPAAFLGDLLQLASGMEYLHGLDPPVLHRDLKSANILIAQDQHTLKIADFGLARYQAHSGAKMTAETGSYRWMAPEVIRHEVYDARCDVYSFAVTAWEMLTYRVPFDNMLPVEAAFAVARSAKRPDIPASCPNDIAQMLDSCWHQEAAQRPPFRDVRIFLEQQHAVATAADEEANAAAKPIVDIAASECGAAGADTEVHREASI